MRQDLLSIATLGHRPDPTGQMSFQTSQFIMTVTNHELMWPHHARQGRGLVLQYEILVQQVVAKKVTRLPPLAEQGVCHDLSRQVCTHYYVAIVQAITLDQTNS